MKKMISIAALAVVLAAPAFAQEAKPAITPAPAAPAAVKPDAGKVMAPMTTGQLKSPADIAADAAKAAAAKKADAPKVDAPKVDTGKAMAPAATPPVMTDKKTEAPKVDVKPMGVGAAKIDAPKTDAAKTAMPAATPATPPAVTLPADVKKQ